MRQDSRYSTSLMSPLRWFLLSRVDTTMGMRLIRKSTTGGSLDAAQLSEASISVSMRDTSTILELIRRSQALA